MHKHTSNHFLANYVSLIFISTLIIVSMPIAQAQENDRIQFSIPPQSVGSALALYSQQAQVQFIYQTDVVEGRETQGVTGWLSPRAALAKLLDNTALVFEFTEQDTIIVRSLTAEEKNEQIVQAENNSKKEEQEPEQQDTKQHGVLPAKSESLSAQLRSRPRLDGLGVEEIVVSARRRTERLQQYPGAASVFGGQFLIDTRVDGMEDIVRRISNASFEERSGGTMNISIRGTGTSTFGSATNTDTAVGLYYDEIYSYVQGSRIPLIFYDMERIEVFKGPQGSLYGRNAVGGAVIAHTARPQQEYEAYLGVELGEFDTRTAEARLNLAVNKNLSLRFSAYYDDRDSYFSNLNGLKEHGDQVVAGRIRLRFQANNDLDILLGYERIEEDKGPQVLVPDRFGKEFISVSDTDGSTRRNTDRWVSHINWRLFEGIELRSITGLTSIDDVQSADINNLLSQPVSGEFFVGEQLFDVEAYQLTQELIMLSTSAGPLEWLLGFSYFEDHKESRTDITSGFPSNGLARSIGSSEGETSMFAAFVDLSYRFNEKLALGVSLRFSDEERTAERSDFLVVNPNTGLPFRQGEFEFEVDYQRLSPGGSISYHWSDEIMTYFKVATAYQAGGTNSRAASPQAAVFGASTALSYEVGAKTSWFDDRLIANLILFRLDQSDYQLRVDNPPFNEFRNIGETKTEGLELEVHAELSEWLTTGISWGYLDAVFSEAPDTPFGDISNNRLPGIPEHTVTLSADIHFPVFDNSEFYLRADYAFTEGGVLGFSEASLLDDHAIFDLKLGIEFRDKYEVHIFAENLFNDVYVITTGLGLSSTMLSPPRTVGVGASFHF